MIHVESPGQGSHPSVSACFQSNDCLEHILRWLTVQDALRCARTSKAFERASAASIRAKGVAWDAPPAATTATATATATPFGVYGRIHGGIDPILGAEGDTAVLHCGLGTPCLDLRAAGDDVDCAALTHLLRIAFRPTAAPQANRPASAATGTGLPSEQPSVRGELGNKPVLKGLAIRSLAIKTKVGIVQKVRY